MFRNIVICSAFLALILVIISLFLPDRREISRSITIDASARKVFPVVSNLHNWSKWHPWALRDPAFAPEINTPENGKSPGMTWSSTLSGDGRLDITFIKPQELFKYRLTLGKHSSTEGSFILITERGQSLLRWVIKTDLGRSPISRLTGILIDPLTSKELEAGLLNIKKLAESRQ